MKEESILLPTGDRVRAMRASRDLVDDYQFQTDAVVTALVLGTPRLSRMLGDSLFRPVPVPTINFQFGKYGKEAFQTKNAKRAMRAKIQSSDRTITKVPGILERFSWMALADRDELANSDAAVASLGIPVSMRAKYASFAQQIVMNSIEKERATVALATSSYSQTGPDLDVTLTDEWDDAVNGDSRTDIRAVASLLAAQNGVQIEDLDVYVTNASYEAAQDDPKFLAKRGNFATAVPNSEELAAYWGVNSVTVGDAFESTDGVTLTSMYGDVAIIKVPVPALGYDQREGQADSLVRFNWSRGVGLAATPFYIPDHTSWAYPWEAWELPDSVSDTTAAIIRNTKT